MNKVNVIVTKLKRRSNARVVVLWLFGGYGRAFIQEIENQKLLDRTRIWSDALASEQPSHIRSLFGVLDGALGIQPFYHHNEEFKGHDQETYVSIVAKSFDEKIQLLSGKIL